MIISDGYNGTPAGFENVCEDETGHTKAYVLHAEANALLKWQNPATVVKVHNVCNTAPCLECAKLIIQAGIIR